LIASRRLSRFEWEAELRSYGCRPLEGKGHLNTAELWQMPWQGYPFTVPVEGGCISRTDLDYLVALIAQSAPKDWTFE
jgi:hypothetical protein